MKKFIFLMLIFVFTCCIAKADSYSDDVAFYDKLLTCSPAKLASTQEEILGMTNGKCHYTTKIDVTFKGHNPFTISDCNIPMQIVRNYANYQLKFLALSKDFNLSASELSQQLNKYNNKINKSLVEFLPYCK